VCSSDLIDFVGLPEQEIAIQIPSSRLHELGLSLSDVAQIINQRSVDLPAGTAAQGDGSRQIRSLSQQRDVEGFSQLPLITTKDGRLLRLGDVADVDWRNQDNQTYLTYRGQPAIQLQLRRTEHEDTLQAARIMRDWLSERQATLPPDIQLIAFEQS